MAFSSLPTTQDIIPRVRRLKTNKFDDYMSLYAGKRYFMCPALPNLIEFKQTIQETGYVQINTYGVNNPEALMAYLDLLETAEYAVPNSSPKSWKKPTNPSLWKSAFLFGRYYLGDEDKPISILIELKGTSSSYVVESCRVISDDEYLDRLDLLTEWIDALRSYYDFFDD